MNRTESALQSNVGRYSEQPAEMGVGSVGSNGRGDEARYGRGTVRTLGGETVQRT